MVQSILGLGSWGKLMVQEPLFKLMEIHMKEITGIIKLMGLVYTLMQVEGMKAIGKMISRMEKDLKLSKMGHLMKEIILMERRKERVPTSGSKAQSIQVSGSITRSMD